jgi:uncharacterized membrane protein
VSASSRLGETGGADVSRVPEQGRMDVVGVGLFVIGAQMTAVSLLMFVSPSTFFEQVAPFGVRNDHYLLDGATFQIALGLGALVAARRPAWRVPVLAILAIQFLLHAINHGLDAGETDKAYVGIANFALLALEAVVILWLLARAVRDDGATR